MGGLLRLVQRGGVWANCGSAHSLLAVPNVTAHQLHIIRRGTIITLHTNELRRNHKYAYDAITMLLRTVRTGTSLRVRRSALRVLLQATSYYHDTYRKFL